MYDGDGEAVALGSAEPVGDGDSLGVSDGLGDWLGGFDGAAGGVVVDVSEGVGDADPVGDGDSVGVSDSDGVGDGDSSTGGQMITCETPYGFPLFGFIAAQ